MKANVFKGRAHSVRAACSVFIADGQGTARSAGNSVFICVRFVAGKSMNIGITCYPTVGGSGILATALGEELARRGHEVHSSATNGRSPAGERSALHFHPVVINDYQLFKYPDYTLPLSVRMAEVSRDHLSTSSMSITRCRMPRRRFWRSHAAAEQRPRVVTTLHGTDTTLLGCDPGYGPAIRHALTRRMRSPRCPST